MGNGDVPERRRAPSGVLAPSRVLVSSLLALGATALAVFLLVEHRVHTLGALPYLLLLACPVLHLFWHLGHGSHSHVASHDRHESPADDGGR